MGSVTSVSVGFRPLQAAHDLITLCGQVGDETIRRLARGVPSAELSADAAYLFLSDLIARHRCRFVDADALKLHETLLLAATLPDDDFETFELATMILLADRLQGALGPDDLYWHWDAFSEHYRLFRAPVRAVVINGFVEAERLRVLPDGTVALNTISGIDVGRVRSDLRQIAASADDAALMAIAMADYGDQAHAHLAVLRAVIAEQGCILRPDQGWVPSEVLELASHVADNGGFLEATAILLVTAMARGDDHGWFDYRWQNLAASYDALPPGPRWAVLSAIRYLYESDPYFDPYPGALFDVTEHGAQLIPLLTLDDRPA